MKKNRDQVALTFDYHDRLSSVVEDLETINRLIPREFARWGCLAKGEAAAIIEGRKRDLLSYIQTICRDHILWSKKLMKQGWDVGRLRR